LEESLDLYLRQKAPAIPKEWKEFLVKIAPYLTIVGIIICLPAVLALLGLSALVVPFGFLGGLVAGRPFMSFNYLISVILLLVTVVFYVLAVPGLFGRTRAGWMWVYYAVLVNAVSNLVSFNIGGLVIGSLLSLYILFQVKEYYK